jgi:hypothetical protein
LKSIVELLNDRIASFAARNENNFAAEFGKLTIENDMVTTFFDEIDKMSDTLAFAFIESLKQDVELIVKTLFMSGTELATFYTFMTMMLRRLSPIDNSFTNALIFCKTLARRINQGADSSVGDFGKFFNKHLLRNYC